MSDNSTSYSSSFLFFIENASPEKLDLMKEVLKIEALITYGIVLGILAAFLLFCLPSYLGWFKYSLKNYSGSPYLPLLLSNYHAMKTNYSCFFVFAVSAVIFSVTARSMVVATINKLLLHISVITITWYTSMYQIVLSIITVHKFINSRQPEEFRTCLSRRNVQTIMVVVLSIVILKDMVWCTAMFFVKIYEVHDNIKTLVLYYLMIYVTFQVLLYISLGFQLTLKSDSAPSPSEKLIVKHIKWIGGIKLVFFIITCISLFTGFEIAIALTLFFSVDMFLIPLVVEVTEIASDKKIVKTNGMKLEALKL